MVGDLNSMTADVTELKREAKMGRMEFLTLRLEVCALSYGGGGAGTGREQVRTEERGEG